CRALAGQKSVGPELANAINAFLHQCDQRKFAPAAPASPLGAVGQAAKLIDQAEARRAALAAPASQVAVGPNASAAKSRGAQ
ncbi:MAG TPA: hypothetical protein VNT26_13655, partial [Candidatus Sulfotelmatobacter sp.]|nr:hypothetical protein [Candidatus Sulfotelmatobacter sp.]